MRLVFFAVFAVASTGCGVGTIPTSAITPTAMTETMVRIEMYYREHQRLPPNLDVLPVRSGYTNRTTDAWDRQLAYLVNGDDAFTLSSLGADNKPGGVGLDADVRRQYRVVDGQVDEVH
jgi:hypothetical protein